MFLDSSPRVLLFAGHYGSGKSTIALSSAAYLRRTGEAPVAVADLDIVNPYFRTADCAELLGKLGIRLVVSDYAGTNVDVPAMPASAYALLEGNERAVIDVGGDDRGALAMGRYSASLAASGDFATLAVINPYRPLTRTCEDTVVVLREIEQACSIPFTHLVFNPALGAQTTADDVIRAVPYAEAVSQATGLPIAFTAARAGIARELEGRLPFDGGILPLEYKISHGGITNG